MHWSFVTSAHTTRHRPILANQRQFLSSDVAGVIDSPTCFSMKTTCWAGAIRTKHAVSACARVMFPPAGFGQKLLAWLTSAPKCTNSFAQTGQSYFKEELCTGILLFCFVTPQVTMDESGKFLFPIENYETWEDFDRTARKSAENVVTERTRFLREG